MTNYLMSNESFFLPVNAGVTARNCIFLYSMEAEIGRELFDQIGFFGYAIQIFFSEEDLREGFRWQTPSAMVVVLPSAENETRENHRAVLEFIRSQAPVSPTIYISASDTFNTRLQVVQSGGRAFFPYPVDIGDLIGTLDNITLPRKKQPYRILIIENSLETASFYALHLEKVGMDTRIVSDPQYLLKPLHDFNPDLVLLDFELVGCRALDLACVIRQIGNFVSVPILFLCAGVNEKRILEAVAAGEDGLLTKPIKPEHLISSVSARVERYRALHTRLNSDGLTGLLSHTAIKEVLKNEVAKAQRDHLPLCYAMIDLDCFKDINDRHGHAVGDRVLKSLARILRQRLRKTDRIGRYGGEEFAVILPNTTLYDGEAIVNKLRSNFSHLHHHGVGVSFCVTFSCGIAELKPDWSAAQISHYADNALYSAKNSGRNCVKRSEA